MKVVAQQEKPTASGLKAADFIADPNKAIGELRAEIKKEIIESNAMFAIGLYLLMEWKYGGGRRGGGGLF